MYLVKVPRPSAALLERVSQLPSDRFLSTAEATKLMGYAYPSYAQPLLVAERFGLVESIMDGASSGYRYLWRRIE